jgi:hypothetical protein
MVLIKLEVGQEVKEGLRKDTGLLVSGRTGRRQRGGMKR